MELTPADVRHLRTGALFLACSVDHDGCIEYIDRVLAEMATTGRSLRIVAVEDFDPEALAVSLGFVMKGLPVTELTPVGDEFVTSLRALERQIGRPFKGIFPLAAANVNAVVPLLTSLQTGVPVIDADPMGRVLPLLSQTTLTAAGVGIGPIAVTGATGESAVIDVDRPARAERIVRAMAAELGGWAATASYPVTGRVLREAGVPGSVTRLIRIGRILDSAAHHREKYDRLRELVGLRRVIRARVTDVEGISRDVRSDQPDRPTSVTLFDETHNRVVRLEIQNEILMLMLDGAVEAVIPDVITMLRPDDAAVASLEDLWIGNTVDILSFRAADAWYRPEGFAIAGPEAFNVPVGGRLGRRG